MAKRTVIAPDEELIVKGKLVVTGDLVQIQQTDTITNLQGNIFTINSDSSSDSAILQLKSGLSGGGTGTLTYSGGTPNVTTGVGMVNVEPGLVGNLHVASGQSIIVSGGATLSGNVFSGNSAGAMAFTSPVTITLSGDTSGSATFINAGDTASITTTLATVNSNVGSFGDAATVPNFTVNAKGLVTAAGETTVNITASQISNFEAASEALFSVSDTGGDGSLSYSAGVFTYTGPSLAEVQARIDNSASNVRAHFSGSTGISISSGAVSITNTGVGAATYGSATAVSQVAVNAQGQITSASDVSIAIPSSQITDLTTTVEAMLSVSDTGGDGSLAYNNTTGVFTYTGPSASEVRAHISGGDGIDFASGVVDVDTTVVRTSGTQSIAGAKTFSTSVVLPAVTMPSSSGGNYVAGDNSTKAASTAYVETAITSLIDGAPGTLNTLNELAAALNDDASAGTKITQNTNDITTLENRNINTGTGLSGGGNLTADRTLTTNDSEIVHDNLSGFVANEHIDHSGVTLTAGAGLTGGGDITVSRTFNVIGGTGITVNANDIQTNDSEIDIHSLSGYVANEHIDHTAVTLTAGDGLSGGGDISASRTFALDLNELTAATVDVANDSVAIIDATDNSSKKESIADLVSAIAGAGLNATNGLLTTTGFSGDIQSVDVGATGVDIMQGKETLGNGTIRYYIRSIDGGTYTNATESGNVITIDGNITAIRGGFSGTGLIGFNSGTGAISTTADNYSSWKFTTGSAGDVDISSDERLTFSGGTGISVSHSGSTITVTNTNTADITGVSAGNGLTGGGTNGDVTLNVAGGYGITANANDIELSNADVRGLFSASGDIAYDNTTGVISFTNDAGDIEGVTAGSGLAGGGTSGTVELTHADTSSQASVNNTGRTYIQDVTLDTYGHVTGLTSATETVVDTNTTYTAGTGLTLVGTEFRNSITQYTDALARGAVSVTDAGGDGSLAYNSTSGAITYTGPSASEVRAHFSAGTGINISSGSISTNDSEINIHNLSGYVANEHIDHSSVTLTAGAGLTGGGTIASNRTFTVGAGSYITVNADDVAVDATTTNTANKVVARDASGNFAAGTITATATQAQYADLAEKYEADADYEPGTVLVIGGDKEVTVTDEAGSYKAVGVVSTNPAYLMNAESNGVAVALRGRVPCKVIGNVNKGDIIVTSHAPGYGMVAGMVHALSSLQIIGRALESKLDAQPGVIEILV